MKNIPKLKTLTWTNITLRQLRCQRVEVGGMRGLNCV